MIVFDLSCPERHVFEAWFGSGADYEEQRERGLVTCPLCGSAEIAKAPMAPAVQARGSASASPDPKQLLAVIAAAQARALEGSTWVGTQFVDRARAMHLGEAEHRPIHGQASPADAKALASEGVPIAPLPLPVVPPEEAN